MFRNILKSAGAFLAGIVLTVILSYGTDYLLRAAGVLPQNMSYVSSMLIVAILLYRTIYNIIGSYVIARLAPNHPMGHALAIGIFGFIGSIAGAVATWNMNLGPHWYPLTLAVLCIPAAWFGGRLYELQNRQVLTSHFDLQSHQGRRDQ